MDSALQQATLLRYAGVWKSWTTYRTASGGSASSLYLGDLPQSIKAKVIVSYLLFLHDRRVSSSDLSMTLSALRHGFRRMFEDVSIFDHESVRLACKGLAIRGRDANIARAKHLRLPVSIDILANMRVHLWENYPFSMPGRLTYIGVALAFNCGFRISEYAMTNNGNTEHAYSWKMLPLSLSPANLFFLVTLDCQ